MPGEPCSITTLFLPNLQLSQTPTRNLHQSDWTSIIDSGLWDCSLYSVSGILLPANLLIWQHMTGIPARWPVELAFRPYAATPWWFSAGGLYPLLAAAMCQCYLTVCLQLWQNMYLILELLCLISWTTSQDKGSQGAEKGVDRATNVAGAAQVCLSVAVHEDLLATVAGGLSSALWMSNVSNLQ